MMEKYAVITGGTKGIGHAICTKLASEGFNIATCSRSPEDLDILRTELEEFNVQVITKEADLGKKNEVWTFAQMVQNQWPHVDILVNNAGIFQPGEILKAPDGQMEEMVQVNLYSAYYLTRYLSKYFRSGSHIFNMCSVASLIAYPNGGSYTISKFALLGFSKAIREELKSSGIRVTALLPGATWSDSWKGVDLPEDRLMNPKDIADTMWGAYSLSAAAVVEEVVIRPQLGDL